VRRSEEGYANAASHHSNADTKRQKPEQNGSEFNAVTLFGEFSSLLDALLVQVYGPLSTKEKVDKIVSHIDDGLGTLRKSKSLTELITHSGLDTIAT